MGLHGMGGWPSGLRCCSKNQKVPRSNPTRCSVRVRDLTHCDAFGDLQVKNVKGTD